jgi:integrase
MSRDRFPQRIKSGSCVVTIYQTPTKGYDSYTIVHYDSNSLRCRRTVTSYAEARKIALEVAGALAAGKPDTLVLTGRDLVVYTRAKDVLRSTGTDLDVAAIQFVQALQMLNGIPLMDAVRMHLERQKQQAVLPKLVSEVVEELLAVKQAKGRSFLYLKDLRVRLERVAKAFACPLANVTTADIENFLASLDVAARTRNNFRLVIGTLIKFGQARGYVAKDHAGIGGVEKSSYTPNDVVVFTPDEIAKLLRHAKPELVPALALGAFAGIRPEEIKRLDWSDIDLQQGHIQVRASSAKTKVRRLITIQPNLKMWLRPHVKDSGPVLPYTNLGNQFLKLACRAEVHWKRNGLRHSFISYSVAQTANVAAVSLEAGNSPQIIAQHYLKVVTRIEARRWFGVIPEREGDAKPTVPLRQPQTARSCSHRSRHLEEVLPAGRTCSPEMTPDAEDGSLRP